MKAILTLCAIALVAAPDRVPVTREVYLMGTRATLSTWSADRAAGLLVLDRLLQPLEGVEAQLSTWRADSELSGLNAAAGRGRVRLSRSLCVLLKDVQYWVNETGGTFDPAVGALARAWDLNGRGRVPQRTALEAARANSGWHRVRFDGEACSFESPAGLQLDAGAFGKGEALDRARAALHVRAPWLIDLGGQVAVSGAPPGGEGWRVGIAHPYRRHEAVTEVTLGGGSLSTSAGSERDRYVDGHRVGHILDPRTGRPATFNGSVSVWHESALAADALSTALFVMGPEEGLRWAEARGVAVLYLIPRAGGAVIRRASPAFAARFRRSP